MPSPFPGMDPFIESQEWSEFHFRAINAIADLLGPRLSEKYVARCQMRVYVEYDPIWPDELVRRRRMEPDVAFAREKYGGGGTVLMDETTIAATNECELPQAEPETRREVYLVLKNVQTHEIVTVLELLSPTNKRSAGVGHEEYLRKRDEILRSDSHFVEIDLLRDGNRMPMRPQSPASGEYIAVVSRSDQRPKAEFVAWSLRQKLPTIPIPLAKNDPDIPLDLQAVLDTVYDRDHYERTLDYTAPLLPRVDEKTQQWITEVLERVQHPASSSDEPHTPR